MKKYNVTVNGIVYEVIVEEAGVVASSPVAAPAPAPVAAPAPAPVAAAAPAGAVTVNAPMPGTILKVNVSAGSEVKEGDVLCILEAMKMENEILAPKSGKVASVNVSGGQSVSTGDLLVSLS